MAPAASRATKGVSSAFDLSQVEPFWKRKHGIKLIFLLTASLLSSFAAGFDGSQTNAMQLLPVWQDKFGNPTGSTLGLFGASTSIGGLIPLIFFNWTSDYFGRRHPTVIGSLIVIAGALVEIFATSLGVFIVGKLIVGIGSTFVQLGAPVLVTELSHPKERAKLTALYNTGVYLGYVIGAWVTFGCTQITSDWQWKLPTILQVIPSVYQISLIYFCPESPRWLVAKGREDKALEVLTKWHGNDGRDMGLVLNEFDEIKTAQAREKEMNTSWAQFFGSRANWKRIFLCTCVATFSQTTGNLLVSNYLGQILKTTGLDSTFESTLINGMSTLWSYICALAVAGLIDTFRRRTFFLTGSIGTLVVFIAWTICAQQYVDRGSIAAGRTIVACIFLFQAFYTFAWINLVVAYPLEIVTYQMRAKAWAYVLLVIYAAQIFGNYVNPVALETIGWKWYIYYCVWIACIVVIVYFFFIETKGPTLEEISFLLDGPTEANKMTKDMEKEGEIEVEHVDKQESVART
ncbi:Sugar (and other) transporter-like protein 64 [Elsinoe fawcettii]|nr:Sugar (and other) transporter-like protein 64 [Elsinoe fawcettii]